MKSIFENNGKLTLDSLVVSTVFEDIGNFDEFELSWILAVPSFLILLELCL